MAVLNPPHVLAHLPYPLVLGVAIYRKHRDSSVLAKITRIRFPELTQAGYSPSILGRSFRLFDDEDFYRSLGRLQAQPQLLP